MKNLITKLMIYSAMIFLLPNSLFSQEAFLLNGDIGENSNGEDVLFLLWGPNDPADETEYSNFTIWMQKGNDTGEFSDFVEYYKIPDDMINKQDFFYEYEHPYQLPEDNYAFFISAVGEDGVVISNIIEIYIRDETQNSIKFIDEANSITGLAGEKINYQFQAVNVNDANDEIYYSLTNIVEGLEIDGKTGEISWTPTKGGTYYIGVNAYSKSNSNNNAVKYLEAVIDNCSNPAKLTVEVKNLSGENVNQGTLELVPKINDDGTFAGESIRKNVNNGIVEFDVDGGEYTMFYRGDLNYNVWYPTVEDRDDAEKLQINCGDNFNLSFNVDPFEYETYTVSGKLTNHEGEEIRSGFVSFEGYIDGKFQKGYVVELDGDGDYSLNLPDIMEYKAHAMTFDIDRVFNGMMLDYPLYYNQTYDPEEAEIIKLTGDLENIDFVFGKLPGFEYKTISGSVLVDGLAAEEAVITAEAFNNDMDDMFNYLYFNFTADENGDFNIELPVGFKYSLKAHINANGFYSTKYYNDTYIYDEAEEILLEEDINNVIFNFDDFSNELNSSISGKMILPQGDITFGYVDAVLVNSSSDLGDAFKGRSVMTDESGNFEIEGLLEGEYVLFAYTEIPDIIPGYYLEGGKAVPVMENATIIELDENDVAPNIVIDFMTMNADGSIGETKAAGKIKQQSTNDAVPGAKIYLMNEEGNAISFGKSQLDGNFLLENAKQGNIEIIVSKPGYKDHKSLIEIDSDKFDIGEIELVPNKTTSVEFENTSIKVYPNPAHNFIKIESENQLNNVKIIDLKGNVVINTNNSYIEINNLATGNYFVEIDLGNKTVNLPLIITR